MVVSGAHVIELHYRIEPALDAWVLPEVRVSESRLHDRVTRQLVELFEAWKVRTGVDVAIARNLAIRWIRSAPAVGIDPDVCIIQPPPPGMESLTSLCTWQPSTIVPAVAIEIVSKNHPYKDYADIQEKYAACGVRELWVMDPGLLGPKKLGGPIPLQIWQRESSGVFTRCFAGDGPYHSSVIDVWVRVHDRSVLLSDDETGTSRWLTGEETERAAKEAAEAERLELEARVRELEERLRSR
jgi:Uma2 family endonuclease